ncbi:cupin domain-containing protein [Pseudoglutamicibacter albus]|uniref:Cupin n=1 Tax=Pseudoglutamicibacter albus DNF00011 TaxID=1401063 RepID=A0A095YDX5_9MICC|nr:cupin domain-containing protein [Pseudoglutamicibacter albus]KGF20645.1 cupin [Pseudoglutamicibacter albus DNF00011]
MSESTPSQTAALGYIDNLAQHIEYSPNSTASAKLMRSEGVNVVLFAFDEGEELSEHTAAMPVIVQALEGELEITTDDQTVTLHPGGMVHFTTRLPHAVKALTKAKMVLYMLNRPPAE